MCAKSAHLDFVLNELKHAHGLTDEDVISSLESIKDFTLEEVFEKGAPAIPKPRTEPTSETQEGLITDDTIFSPEVESKINDYEKTLQNRDYFAGLFPGTTEYKSKQRQARKYFLSNFGKSTANADRKEKAEEYKMQGNSAFSALEFEKAREYYTRAIELDPQNHICFANRAAAFFSLRRYHESITDCLTSILLDSKYVKAYTRLGTSYRQLNMNAKAIKAFTIALELEPDNTAARDGIAEALSQPQSQPHSYVHSQSHSQSRPQHQSQQPQPQSQPNLPDFSQLLDNPLVQNTLSNLMGPDGASGIASMLNQPGVTDVVGNLLNNPELMGMATNFASSFLRGAQNPAQTDDEEMESAGDVQPPNCNQQ